MPRGGLKSTPIFTTPKGIVTPGNMFPPSSAPMLWCEPLVRDILKATGEERRGRIYSQRVDI